MDIISPRKTFSFPRLSTLSQLICMLFFWEMTAAGTTSYIAYASQSTTFTSVEIGRITLWLLISPILGGLLATLIADKWKTKYIVLASCIIAVLSFYALKFSTNYYSAMFCALLMGISSSTFLVSNNLSLLQLVSPDENRLRMVQSIKEVAANLGIATSIVMISRGDSVFQTISVMYFLFSLIAIKLFSITRQANKIVISVSETIAVKPLKKRKLYIVISSVFFLGLIVGRQEWGLPWILLKFDNFKIVSLVIFMNPILAILFQIKITRLFSKISSNYILMLSIILLGTGLLSQIYVTSLLGLFLSCLVLVSGKMLFIPTSSALCFKSVENNKRGFILGAWQTAFASGAMIGPTLSFVLTNHF